MSEVGTSAESTDAIRGHCLGVLARARPDRLENVLSTLPDRPAHQWLRPPETGLVMVRARAGGSGRRFNVGEMTATRCAVTLADGTVGHGYVAGRDRRHAELVALLDAVLGQSGWEPGTVAGIIGPLQAEEHDRREARQRRAAETRVDFFTMVRGSELT